MPITGSIQKTNNQFINIMKRIAIIVDLQEDFCGKEGVLSNAECVAAADKAAQLLNRVDFDEVVYTLDTHQDDTYPTSQEGNKLPVKHCIEGTPGWYLRKDIADAVSNWSKKHEDKWVIEVRKGSFGYDDWFNRLVNLEQVTDARGDGTEFYIFGCCTDICVVSNALLLKASFPEVPIYVVEDCCGGVSVPCHAAAIKTMQQCQINIVKSNQIN